MNFLWLLFYCENDQISGHDFNIDMFYMIVEETKGFDWKLYIMWPHLKVMKANARLNINEYNFND